MYKWIKPLLFTQDPEKIHHSMIGWLSRAGDSPAVLSALRAMYEPKADPLLQQELFGLTFRNPVGLAAGLDKNAEAIPAFSSIGLGFVEVGTLTPRPQAGNDLPRLFRLPSDEAVINRMGFNNRGAKAAAETLSRLKQHSVPIGINIGKNKTTPNEEAHEDYRDGVQILYPYADYFVINVSSPNTPDLRSLQHGEELAKLVSVVQQEIVLQSAVYGRSKPVLVKIAPDLTEAQLASTVEVLMGLKVAGIIATNTTIERGGLRHPHAKETGGLSGRPLTSRSTEIIRQVYRLTEGRVPIIGVGGVFNGQDAYDKVAAGASLVQVYTGLIYEGPGITRSITQELSRLLRRDGYSHLTEAVGRQV